MRRRSPRGVSGFTLVEILIVVSIILILVAIALPSFTQAASRAKVTRAWAEMRSLSTVLESYALDYRVYPLHGEILANGTIHSPALLAGLSTVEFLPAAAMTTPVAYLENIPEDPTFASSRDPFRAGYGYINSQQMKRILFGKGFAASANALEPRYGLWRLYAAGPDGDKGEEAKTGLLYDPTNGSESEGDLVVSQKIHRENMSRDES